MKGIDVPFLIEIIKSRLGMKALPPQLQKQLEAKMGEYPNPLVAIETADQLNALGMRLIFGSDSHSRSHCSGRSDRRTCRQAGNVSECR